jgi:hypothetical protein
MHCVCGVIGNSHELEEIRNKSIPIAQCTSCPSWSHTACIPDFKDGADFKCHYCAGVQETLKRRREEEADAEEAEERASEAARVKAEADRNHEMRKSQP